jgi:hypothetical protein
MNHHFAVLGRSFLSQDHRYSVALVELAADKNEYAVYTEYRHQNAAAAARRGRSTLNVGQKFNFEAAKITYDGLVRQKTNPSPGSNPYMAIPEFEMTNVLLMPEVDAQTIIDRHAKKKLPPPPSDLDFDDPKLLECLEDDMWVGVLFNNNDHSLAKIGQNVFFDDVALESNHPLYIDAHELGGEFRFAGYSMKLEGSDVEAFHAFDMSGDAYRNSDYGTRIQLMANYISQTETSTIELAQFVVGKENKTAALDKIGKTFTHIRFMRMDKSFTQGSIRLFPT